MTRSTAAFFVVLLVAAGLTGCGDRTKSGVLEADKESVPMGQLGVDVTPAHYRLNLSINPEAPRFEGTVEIDVKVAQARRIVYLHAKNLDVKGVIAKNAIGQAQSGTFEKASDTGVAKLSFRDPLAPGLSTLVLTFEGNFSATPDTLWVAKDNGLAYAATQFQALGARKAFPSFDEPRFKTPFDVTITARTGDVVIANEAMKSEEPAGAGLKRVRFETTKPLPTYLVAYMVGPYDVFAVESIAPSKVRANAIPLRGITVKGKGERMRYALQHTPAILSYLEDYFGVPYPYGKLDIIAPPNFAAGGMENAGAITYAERVILLDENAPAKQKAGFFLIHAHELAHQWFGDYVTPAWWDDIWLNEAFASWMEAKAAAAVAPGQGYERETVRSGLRVMDLDSLKSARAIRQPIESDGDIFNAFDGLTYSKGAAVLAMFEGFAGEEAFREGVRLHMKRFGHGVATAKDFLQSLSEGTQKPQLAAAFETFLTQSGVPFMQAKLTCKDGVGLGELSQRPFVPTGAQPPERQWKVPVCLRNMKKNEPQQCALVESRAAQVAMLEVCPDPAVLLNARGNGYYRFDAGPEGWTHLLATMGDMTTAEHLVLLDSVRAAFFAGTTDAKNYWSVLERLALSPEFDVVNAVGEHFLELRDKLSEGATRAQFEAKLAQIYGPQFKTLMGQGLAAMSPRAAERRATIAFTLARAAGHAEALKLLSDMGLRVLDAQATSAASTIDPNLVPAALWAAAHREGAATTDKIIAAFKASRDGEFRRNALQALAGARDQGSLASIAAFIPSPDLRTRDRLDLLRALFEDGDMRPKAWTMLKSVYDSLMPLMPEGARASLVRMSDRFCDATLKGEAEAFFTPKAKTQPGAPRLIANALENMDRCIALKAAKGEEFKAVLAGK